MGLLALIFDALGWICALIGIITAVEVMPLFTDELTWVFWFGLSAILFLASIAFGRAGRE